MTEPYKAILVEREAEGVTFVILNRPEKRNAMSPQLHREMCEALNELEAWLTGKSDVPQSWPGRETLAPALSRKGRHGAILLPFRTLLAAIEEAK